MARDNTTKPTTRPESSRNGRRRHSDDRFHGFTSVRLTRKYAEMIDGVNLKNAAVGDRLELPKRDADVLIAEGWAEHAGSERRVRLLPRRALAAEISRASRKKSRT